MDVHALRQGSTVLTTVGAALPFRYCCTQITRHHRIAFALLSHFTPKSLPLRALKSEATSLSCPSPPSSSRRVHIQGSRRRIKYHPHPLLLLVAAANPYSSKERDPREDEEEEEDEAGLKVKVETPPSPPPSSDKAENFQQIPAASASASETVRVTEEEQRDWKEEVSTRRKRGEDKVEKAEFWRGVLEETALIEWPPFQKVLGTTGVVLAVMVGSSAVLLTVNAILAEISDKIFNGIGVQDILWGVSK